MKRLFDVIVSFFGLGITTPILLSALLVIWLHDFKSPFYISTRIGKSGRPFRMVKLRSMMTGADAVGIDSTSEHDPRVTPFGWVIRKSKLDELPQLWNVLKGDMSIVGPRPNVERETRLYTQVERDLLSVRPGITDFSSIVFSDLGEILGSRSDPDIAYNQLIRPWKSKFGLLYIQRQTMTVDLMLIWLTVVAIFSRKAALNRVVNWLQSAGAPEDLVSIARRDSELVPHPPPGSDHIVTQR